MGFGVSLKAVEYYSGSAVDPECLDNALCMAPEDGGLPRTIL